MKKSKLFLAICTIMLCAIPAKTAFANDTDNLSTKEMQSAATVTYGTSSSYTWEDNNTPLLTKIVLPSDGILTATMDKPSHRDFGILNIDFYLYDSTGKCIQHYRDDEDARTTAQWKCGLTAGTYYVKEDVQYWVSSAQTKAYNFTFSAGDYYEKENNNTKETATAIQTDKTYIGELGGGFSNIDSDDIRDSQDIYKVNLIKGYTYHVETKNLQGTTLALFLTKDIKLGTLSDLGTGKNVVAPYTGTYYIQIYNYSSDQYEYTLDVKTVTPIATKISKIKSGKKALTVSYKTKDVTGYEIAYSTKKNFSKSTTKKLITKSKKSVTIKKLKSKKKYYVRIRTYRTIGKKKYYSKWSAIKTGKTK